MTDKFDPRSKITKMQGRNYLEVKWRIVWFRSEHPKGGIQTDVVGDDLIKATITDADGNVLATGHGSSKKQGVAKSRPYEGAETAAIGRALAHAGYGTQLTDEDEGEHLADAPVERGNGHDGDVITVKAWEAWQELVKRAEAVEIPVAKVDRNKTTKTDLRAAYKELLEIVNNAEEQAKAGVE